MFYGQGAKVQTTRRLRKGPRDVAKRKSTSKQSGFKRRAIACDALLVNDRRLISSMSFPTALATTARYVGTAAFVSDDSSVGFTEADSHYGVETDGQEHFAARSQPGLPSMSEYLTDCHDGTYEMPTSSPSAHQQQQHASGSRYALSNLSDHTEVSHATLQPQQQQQRQAQRQQMQPHRQHAAGSHMAYSEASPAPSVPSDTGHASAINANLAAASAAASAVAAAASLKEKEMAIWNALTDEEKKLATILFKKHGLSGQDGGAH